MKTLNCQRYAQSMKQHTGTVNTYDLSYYYYLQRVVSEFFSVCKRRKLKVNVGKSKVMVFERREEEVINFNTAYRVRLPAVVSCRIMLGSEKMEEVSEFKYLGTVLFKHGQMEGEIRE